jgi:hypothetical protein
MSAFGFDRGGGLPRDIGGGSTALEALKQFAVIRTSGVSDLVKELERLAGAAAPEALKGIVLKAARPIENAYRASAKQHEATGNLAESVTHKTKVYPRAVVAVIGPKQTGNRGGLASGNHAFLVEFGSGPRRPGTENRRTYVNVHQMINRRMHRHSSANDQQFAAMGAGYYFLMGSINEPSRQGGGKPGYSRDFMLGKDGKSGRQHPIVLHPGETLAPMPAYHLMENAVKSNEATVAAILRSSLEKELSKR